ncbi:MAG: TolC family protein [Myxococcota bacterium]
MLKAHLVVFAAGLASVGASDQTSKSVHVIVDSESTWGSRLVDAIRDNIESVSVGGESVQVVSRAQDEDAAIQLATMTEQPGVRVVVVVGSASIFSARTYSGTTPVIAAGVIDASAQNIDVERLYLTAPLAQLERKLELLTTLLPAGSRVVLPVLRSEREYYPSLTTRVRALNARFPLTLEVWEGSPQELSTLNNLPAGSRGLMLDFLRPQSLDIRRAIARGATESGLAVAADERVLVDEGHALLSTEVPKASDLIGRQVAILLNTISERAKGERDVEQFSLPRNFVFSPSVAKRLRLRVPFSLLNEAEVVSGNKRSKRLEFSEAIRLALDRNPDYRAALEVVRAGEASVDIARGPLLPQIAANTRATLIDEDRGEGPFPPAERTYSWGLNVRQQIYGPEPFLGFRAERSTQKARDDDLHAERLDLIAATAIAYLDVLRAKTTERVQRQNLVRVRRNLEVAEARVALGAVGRDEGFRWRIEIANGLRAVIEAVALRNRAEIRLNQILNRAPETPFSTGDTESLPTLGADLRLQSQLEDLTSFDQLRDFAAEEALRFSPELQALEHRREAVDRELSGAYQTVFVPDVALEGSLTHRYLLGGAGSEAGGAVGFTVPNDWDWSVGVVASLPLFEGASNYGEISRLSAERARIDAELQSERQRLRSDVRAALHIVGSSYAAIRLNQDAAEAARENLELVRDAYAQGRLDVIRLVDAQAQSLVSELNAANAYFNFLVDSILTERAIGRFSFGPEPRQPDTFFQELRTEPNPASEESP